MSRETPQASGCPACCCGVFFCTELTCSPPQSLLLGQEAPRPQGSSDRKRPAGSRRQLGPGGDPQVHQAPARASPGRHPPSPVCPAPTSLQGCVRYTLPSPQNPPFTFSASSRGNTLSKDEIPRLSSLAQPSEHSRYSRASTFPTGEPCREAMGGRGKADAHAWPTPPPGDHHRTSSAPSCWSHLALPCFRPPSLPWGTRGRLEGSLLPRSRGGKAQAAAPGGDASALPGPPRSSALLLVLPAN